jgi:hypothetical protein
LNEKEEIKIENGVMCMWELNFITVSAENSGNRIIIIDKKIEEFSTYMSLGYLRFSILISINL